jgi:DegV family protein with EDD domain
MKLAIVTDSTAYLTADVKSHKNLSIIPIPVIVDGQIYNEGVDIAEEDYFSILNSSQEFPTTSQPAVGEVITLFEKLKADGYDTVLCVYMSLGISGFGRTLEMIKNDFEGLTILPYDSQITSVPMGTMVSSALHLADAGVSLTDIVAHLNVIRSGMKAFMIVDDLNNLVRGGRLTNGAAIIGSLLKIKPILTFEEGKINLHEKIRSQKKALHRTEDLVGEYQRKISKPYKLFVIHANNLPVALEEKARLTEIYPGIPVEVATFGPVIGTHLGEKAVALGVCPL